MSLKDVVLELGQTDHIVYTTTVKGLDTYVCFAEFVSDIFQVQLKIQKMHCQHY